MNDFIIENNILKKYTGYSKIVAIPNGIKRIGSEVFKDLFYIEEVILADGITSIGKYAFLNCTNLRKIEIPNTLMTLGEGAFENCSSLKEIEIPRKVIQIKEGVFKNCSSLEFFTWKNPNIINKFNMRILNLSTIKKLIMGDDRIREVWEFGEGYHYMYKECVTSGERNNIGILGFKGTSAEEYAQSNNIPFISLDETINEQLEAHLLQIGASKDSIQEIVKDMKNSINDVIVHCNISNIGLNIITMSHMFSLDKKTHELLRLINCNKDNLQSYNSKLITYLKQMGASEEIVPKMFTNILTNISGEIINLYFKERGLIIETNINKYLLDRDTHILYMFIKSINYKSDNNISTDPYTTI